MLLSARILTSVANANVFSHANAAYFTEGDGPSVYFQLIDASLDRADQGFQPPGRRYMPASAATLQVTIQNIDDAKTLVRYATQPFAADPSIWVLALLSTDTVRGTADMRLKLTEGVVVTQGVARQVLSVQPLNTSYANY